MADDAAAGGSLAATRVPALGAILAVGLVLRLLTFWLLPDQGFPDARAYVDAGRDLFAHGVMQVDIYMPLYPIWTWLWGDGLKLADIALSVATIWLVHELTIAIVNDARAARLAALAAAIYPHFIFYAVSGLTETPYLFLLCGAFLLFYRELYSAASVALILSILVRPTLDYLTPLLLIVFVAYVHRCTGREAARRVGIYALIYVVLMAPWWAHNYEKYGQFVRLDLGDGVVLFSGNNPLNQSGGGVGGGAKGDDMDPAPFTIITDPIQRNEAYKKAALDFITENPGRFVELAGLKFLRFWRLWPYAPEYESSAIILVSLLSYGVVFTLALGFIAAEGWERRRRIAPIMLLIAYLTAVHMVTIGSLRYRLPLEPFLIVFAARAASMLARRSQPLDRMLRAASL